MYEEEFIINELRSMHLTYLDSTYDRKVLDLWKTISWNCPDDSEIWQNCSLYEYIGGHLGYRLTVTNAEMRPLRRGKAEFVIEIENTGFGKMFQETELFLTVENENEIRVVSVSINLREIQAGSRKCGKAVIDLMEGRVFLKLQRKKDGQINTVQTTFIWEVCTGELFILLKSKGTYRNGFAVFIAFVGKVDRILCIRIFHTQRNRISSFFQRTDIQIYFKF